MMAEESNFYHITPQLLISINKNLERIAVALEEYNRNSKEAPHERLPKDDRR